MSFFEVKLLKIVNWDYCGFGQNNIPRNRFHVYFASLESLNILFTVFFEVTAQKSSK